MTTVELQKFLEDQQGEHHNEADLDELLERHEPDPGLRAMGIMSFEGFARMLMDEDNYAFQELQPEEDETSSHPLSHFYIASSHNTYLTGHQLKGESSIELYSQVSFFFFFFFFEGLFFWGTFFWGTFFLRDFFFRDFFFEGLYFQGEGCVLILIPNETRPKPLSFLEVS